MLIRHAFQQLAALLLMPGFFGAAAISAQERPNAPGSRTPEGAERVAALQARIEALQRELRAFQPESAPTLEDRLEALDAQVRVLARQLEIDREQAAARAKQTPQASAGRSGFLVQSADGSFRLRLRGLLHSDGRFFPNDADSRGIDTFVLRRVRPIIEATVYDQFDLRIMPDFGNGATVLQDAYLEARLRPQVKVRAGKFKAPVGLERLTSAAELTFIERALPTLLVPNRDIGVMVHGDVAGARVAYAAGVFNGVADGGSADTDIQDGKDIVARLFAQPFRAHRDSLWQGLGAGMAASYGTHRGVSATNTGLPTFRTSGQQSFFGYRGADSALGPVLADGPLVRISAQGHFYRGPLGLLAEHVRSVQDVRRGAEAATLANTAWQFAGTWALTGEHASSRGITPRTPFDPVAGAWGAIELTARGSALTIDEAAFPRFANPATAASGAFAWAVGANWTLNTGVRLQVNYERTRFDAAGVAPRRAEHDILTRIQFGF